MSKFKQLEAERSRILKLWQEANRRTHRLKADWELADCDNETRKALVLEHREIERACEALENQDREIARQIKELDPDSCREGSADTGPS